MATILGSSLTSEYNIQDSFKLADLLKTVKLPRGYVLVSFDVISLFTNIPKDLIIYDLIMHWDVIGKVTDISLDLFLEIVEFLLQNSYFCFRQKVYRQTDGTAMGSPISPSLADLVMELLLLNVTAKLDFDVPILKKYVDDLLLALPTERVQETLCIFNSYHPKLQFTMEEERENQLPFLDLLITRNQNQTLDTEWYCKPIASGRLLNYFSFHPLKMKLNVAQNFIKRVITLDSTHNITKQQLVIRKFLKLNNYPASLVNRMISQARSRTTSTQLTQQQTTEDQLEPAHAPSTDANNSQDLPHPIFRSLTHIPNLSERITKHLKHDFTLVKVANSIVKTTQNILPNVKDPIDRSQLSQVVYKIPCANCEKVYIGMTKNCLQTRLSGHRTNINKYNALVERGLSDTDAEILWVKELTALMEHIVETKHSFDLGNTKIIDLSRKVTNLPMLEMCHIVNNANTVNHRTDVKGLSNTYAGILHSVLSTHHPHTTTNTEQSLSQ